DEFTINLSLINGKETVFSVIAVPCEQVVYLGYLQDLPFKYSFSQQQWYQYQVSSTSLDAPIQIGLSHGSKNPKYQKFI
ncbi:3'(2'),5'-bisphosphate nucleotidase CysQ, partial [Klebsiella pneumoniae]|nr:3'(2'),5'-bisphosphate nucleotidase CysQ [Klebsiella pneumoniae]